MTTEITRLLTRTGAAGDRIEFTLTLDGGEVRSNRFTGRYGTVRGGSVTVDCLYKVGRGEGGRRAIEHEIAVFSGLGWAGVKDGRFAELLGYDLDPDEGGAVLLQTRRGRALAHRSSTTVPTEDELWRPTHDLLSALKVLAHHKYVHGGISSTTVFWDGAGLQIADLSMATTQTSDADGGAARDVRHAAGLLYWLATGEQSAFGYQSDGTDPDQEFRHLKAHRTGLATVLRPVYEGESPTAEELLARMTAWPRPADLPAHRPAAPPDPPARKDGEHTRQDDTETQEISADPPAQETGADLPVPEVGADPPAPEHDPDDVQIRKYLGERLTTMHGQPDRPVAAADPVPAAFRRPEPGSLPPDFPFRVDADGTRHLHPLVWVGVGALVLMFFLVAVLS